MNDTWYVKYSLSRESKKQKAKEKRKENERDP